MPFTKLHPFFVPVMTAGILLLMCALANAQVTKTEEKQAVDLPKNPFPKAVKVPTGMFEGGKKWLNTEGPITLKDVKGKIVLIDFWTYCCINCIHVLPDLKYLEKKYPNELVVIGVHSAKFDNEKDSENIRRAIMRYEIEHPVINDAEMKVWRKFGVRSWPTLAVIDPEGKFIGKVSGEGNRKLLDQVVSDLIKYHAKKGTLDRTPVKHLLEASKLKPSPLKFPGKILADEKGDRLFIADSNHNRIVVTTLKGQLLDIIGSGKIDNKDGHYQQAGFDHPQGMTLVGEQLYVADTENHLLRVVDLKKKTVITLAGTGKQARTRKPGGELLKTALNSPWDLVHVDGTIYIAMAGPHQIWRHQIGKNLIEVHAGSGREDIINGPLATSALAQPSGIVSDGKYLYVCDSEGSSIRQVAISQKGSVFTLVGEHDIPRGQTLFEFGDKDGKGDTARFQHPLGIAIKGKTLFIADTYNQKIKKVTIGKLEGEAKSWLGDGKRGDSITPPRFSDPAGLTLAGNTLFIADTNNHRILTAEINSNKVKVLTIAGLKPPEKTTSENSVTSTKNGEAIKVKQQQVTRLIKQKAIYLPVQITPTLPKGFHLNKLYPTSVKVTILEKSNVLDHSINEKKYQVTVNNENLEVLIPLKEAVGKARIRLDLRYSFCNEGKNSVCRFDSVSWEIPFQVDHNKGQKQLLLKATVSD